MVGVDALAGIPLFEPLSRAELEQLAGWFDVREVSEGVRLTGEGAPGYSFYVLVEGTAVVSAGDTTVAGYAPGDFFGEMAILGDGRRSATVTTTSPARVLVMFGTEFRQLQQAHPGIAAHLEEAMQRRRQELSSLQPAVDDAH
jgi:CRP-like cAMP-binding protein